eukprot:TRINITY_DN38383_c0_g1_i1.p1 TRINITY_DN38383_c0_g1~~TRINITY_DN38383_c0_g1_i1.p1  ORF type:complete len:712 (-),score=164.15 TRINITY_DN38383_c0_g1_i1:90-2225(-)
MASERGGGRGLSKSGATSLRALLSQNAAVLPQSPGGLNLRRSEPSSPLGRLGGLGHLDRTRPALTSPRIGVSARGGGRGSGGGGRGRGVRNEVSQTPANIYLAELPDDLKQLREEVLAGLESEGDSDTEDDAASSADKAPDAANSIGSLVGEDDDGELTERAVLAASGENCLEDVTALVFRDRNLMSLETPRCVDFLRLTGIEVLSLSHNKLTDIGPLFQLVALIEVNVNFNQLEDISPLFECDHLEKLFAAHNQVGEVAGLDVGCPCLKELSLFANVLDNGSALIRTLQKLPDLRSLDVGHNPCCSSPAQRYGFLRALPQLNYFDGQLLTQLDRQLAADFEEAASEAITAAATSTRPSDAMESLSFPSERLSKLGSTYSAKPSQDDHAALLPADVEPQRPRTAPAAAALGTRRPPLPTASITTNVQGAATDATAATLEMMMPGQRLRSARSNKIDDVLRSSRDPSPEILGSLPMLDSQKIDLRNPQHALQMLAAHGEALKRRLETLYMTRDNLKFQVRLLERDAKEALPEKLEERIASLELENRSARALDDEQVQLQSRLSEVEEELKKLPAAPEQLAASEAGGAVSSKRPGSEKESHRASPTPSDASADHHPNAAEDESEVLQELRWENKLLEKRFKRLSQYSEDLAHAAMRQRLLSRGQVASNAPPPPPPASSTQPSERCATPQDLNHLLRANEARLQELRKEVGSIS